MKNIIKRIAKEFNQKGIVWAIGGSYLLKRYGINTKIETLDIMVSEHSIIKVLGIMDRIATIQEVKNDYHFQTDHYKVYIIEGLIINIICNFKSNFVEKFEYNFNESDINIHESISQEKIYYGFLIDWYLIYSEINMKDEVNSIEEYYINGGFFNNNRFEEKFMKSNYQIVEKQYCQMKNEIYN